ncbi:hypothetical protein MWU57_07870 [Isoptericola sp. S6320L]|uniref:hypothetical protein n=1 Tax=Isoptericola sp. S6320L TaxID=2926411 RepID=UPI001FF39DD7|nr:hypothetical protein [Isoptericola sp. S6320L]MCK0116950.1 hypothetical protein [Isoptericola sp. S6320L]
MTTATTGPARTGTLHHRAVAAARRRLQRYLLRTAVWFWAGWGLLVLSVPVVVDRFGGEADGLTYDAAGSPARWPAFAVGIILTAALLGTHLAAGGTRRSLVEGFARGAVVGGLVFGVLTVVLGLVEEQVYSALDRPYQGAGGLPLDSVTGVAATVVAQTLVIVTYVLVGAAVQGGYRRWGSWRGTLAVVPLLVPGALADLASRSGIFAIPLRDAPVDSLPGLVLAVVGTLLAASLAGGVAHGVLRHARPRPS